LSALRQVADEFDSVHDIRRVLRVGSVDHTSPAADLRQFIIGVLERRLVDTSHHTGHGSKSVS